MTPDSVVFSKKDGVLHLFFLQILTWWRSFLENLFRATMLLIERFSRNRVPKNGFLRLPVKFFLTRMMERIQRTFKSINAFGNAANCNWQKPLFVLHQATKNKQTTKKPELRLYQRGGGWLYWKKKKHFVYI